MAARSTGYTHPATLLLYQLKLFAPVAFMAKTYRAEPAGTVMGVASVSVAIVVP